MLVNETRNLSNAHFRLFHLGVIADGAEVVSDEKPYLKR
jgi:hypothetical protein